jgi:hypothetical protein
VGIRIFKTRWFSRFAKRELIDDKILCEAIERTEIGLIDANLGSDVLKQRIGRKGQGRSKGYRVLVAYRVNNRAVFMYGFSKKERDNIDDDELESLKEIAAVWLNANDNELRRSLANGSLQEVNYEKKI